MTEVSVSEASRNLSHWINQASYGRDLVVITSRGKAKAVLIGADSFATLIGLERHTERELTPSTQLQQQFQQALAAAGYADREAILELARSVKKEMVAERGD